MRGTNPDGTLSPIPNCYVNIPGAKKVVLNALPGLSDSKQAEYNDEPIIGRATTLKTYSHSGSRSISITFHFYLAGPADVAERLSDLRAIESAVYPREDSSGAPFIPPPVCQIRCGRLLGDNPVCAVLRSYNVRFPEDVVWVEQGETFLPMKFDVETQWDVVYTSNDLPGQDRIFSKGV